MLLLIRKCIVCCNCLMNQWLVRSIQQISMDALLPVPPKSRYCLSECNFNPTGKNQTRKDKVDKIKLQFKTISNTLNRLKNQHTQDYQQLSMLMTSTQQLQRQTKGHMEKVRLLLPHKDKQTTVEQASQQYMQGQPGQSYKDSKDIQAIPFENSNSANTRLGCQLVQNALPKSDSDQFKENTSKPNQSKGITITQVKSDYQKKQLNIYSFAKVKKQQTKPQRVDQSRCFWNKSSSQASTVTQVSSPKNRKTNRGKPKEKGETIYPLIMAIGVAVLGFSTTILG